MCLGTLPLAGAFSQVPESQAVATLHAALDAGLTFLDTAEGYTGAEAIIGKAIRGRRHEVTIATKVSGPDHSTEHIDTAIDNSLKALGTEYVDIYQLHQPRAEPPIERTMAHLLSLREAGKIRYIGISNFSADETNEAAGHGPVHSSQPRYSLLFRDAETTVLHACQDNGIGVIAHSVLAKGLLGGRYRPGHRFPPDDERSKWPFFQGDAFKRVFAVTERLKGWCADHGRDLVQLAIAWPLAHPAVKSSIVGAKSPEQARDNAKAAGWNLSEQDLKEIDEIQGDLRLRIG